MSTQVLTPQVLETLDDRDEAATMPLERLEAEITNLAGHLAAAECRWLLLLAEFDRREGWTHWGCKSLVEWLGWQCGLDARSARERVRVARALRQFVTVREEFAKGRLSYSKVRAITRIATTETETWLTEWAQHATAAQIERIVAGYRRAFEPKRRADEQAQFVSHHINWLTDDDGSLVVTMRLPADDGARFRGQVEARTAQSIRNRPSEKGETVPMRRADALMDLLALAEADRADDAIPADPADRHLVMINVDEIVLTNDEGTRCEVDGGPGIAAETARRIACDASVVRIVRGPGSEVVDIGRKTRVPPRWMRRMLHARDGGCRFPGCGERRIVSGHHVQHWTRGGDTELTNLIELCRFHHRLVHEGGWTVAFDGVGTVTFFRPDGSPVVDGCRSGSAEPFSGDLETQNARRGLDVTPTSVVPNWYGESLDLHSAVSVLVPACGPATRG